MTDLVYLGDPPPYIVIPPIITHYLGADGHWYLPGRGTTPANPPVERTVPVSLDLDAECPACGGEGYDYADDSGVFVSRHSCVACGGSGVVTTLWHAEQQWRAQPEFKCGDEWHAPDAPTPEVMKLIGRTEADYETVYDKRLVVVARYTVQPLPVYDDCGEDGDKFPHIDHRGIAGGWALFWDMHTVEIIHADEPWAEGLVPGATVLALGDRIELDQPLTEMVCGECNYETPCNRCNEWQVTPLRLVPGLNTGIRLAR